MNYNIENILKKLKNNGYYVIDNYFSNNDIEVLNNDFENFMKNNSYSFHLNEDFIKCKTLDINFEKNFNKDYYFEKLNKDKLIYQISKKYLKKNYKPSKFMACQTFGQINDNYSKNKKFAFVPHSDETYFLKFFIYLSDVNIENGPLSVAPGSHIVSKKKRHKWILSGKDYLKRDKVNLNYESEMLPLIGKRGTMIIFDTDIIHKGGVPKDGMSRKVLRYDVYSSSENYNTFSRKVIIKINKFLNFN